MDEVGYSNWANGDIKNGYVYMDSESGTWKTAPRPVKKTVLCVSISRGNTTRGTSRNTYTSHKNNCQKI